MQLSILHNIIYIEGEILKNSITVECIKKTSMYTAMIACPCAALRQLDKSLMLQTFKKSYSLDIKSRLSSLTVFFETVCSHFFYGKKSIHQCQGVLLG